MIKSIPSALTLCFALAHPALAEERQYLCTSEHMVGFRGQGDAGVAYGKYRPFDIEAKAGKYILKVDGDQLSLNVVRKVLPAEIGNANCGFLNTAVNNIKTAVCIDAYWNFHMDTSSLRFVASSTSVDAGVGTYAHIGSCTEF